LGRHFSEDFVLSSPRTGVVAMKKQAKLKAANTNMQRLTFSVAKESLPDEPSCIDPLVGGRYDKGE
jgi:hypothetical protein